MMPFVFNFEVPQSNQDWDSHHVSTYSPPPPWSEELLYIKSHHDMTSIGRGTYGQQNFADIYSPQGQYPLVPDVYQHSQKQSLEDTLQSFLHYQQTSCPQPIHEEFMYNEPCPICFSHSHFVTECPQAREFPEFVQKYVNTTHGCLNPSSDNSYSYTQDNEWETHSNSSWTQEPWVDDSNTFCPPSQFIAPSEQPCQHYYPLLPPENSDFEDSMLQTLQEYEATIQTFASICQSIAELGIQTDKLVHMDLGHKEQESLTQAQPEPIWEVETISERHNGEL
ncbi:Nitrogen regulatory protein like [Actinidia chinensis var. chinensis]|uniref:Nitrogen regulatory protein like n=1 Tax=Actinidia chinensis var. chinensis TaxID=1590841 RepID=A0A2R6PWJ6_ACTCC|nr:Nitrogen regulatory protein like [Actinidia chinensis var. chinensis]